MRAKVTGVFTSSHGCLWPLSSKHRDLRPFYSPRSPILTTLFPRRIFVASAALTLSKMSDDSEAYVPPAWGFFATELFLTKNWNWDASDISDDEQRHQLVAQFLKTSPVPENCVPEFDGETKTPLHQPSEKEIEVILEPWRSSSLRRTAYEIVAGGRSELIVLRTDYSDESHNDTLKEWFEDEEDSDPFYEEADEEWRVLNDESRFQFSDSDWLSNILFLLPELGGRPTFDGASYSKRDRSLSGDDFDFIGDKADPIVEAQFRAFSYTSRQPLVVADKEGLEEGMPLLVFLDGFGNIVRSVRSPAENLGWEKVFHQQGKSRDHAWQNAEVGDAYKEDGEVARVLYPAVREVVNGGGQ